MSYTPTTDFLALLRQSTGGVEIARVPGLDYVTAALARMGVVTLSTGQTAPIVNQPTTVWLRPAEPSWTAEGTVFLWNAATGQYEVATPALWTVILTVSTSGYVFQSAAASSQVVAILTSLVAVQRVAPDVTALRLPAVASRQGKPLQITDWSTGVVSHVITLTPASAETIQRRTSWALLSTADQLAGITLYPSTDLNGWVIAP